MNKQMRTYDGDPDNAYILLRVFDIDDEDTGLKIFPNPWSLYIAGVIDFKSAEGYQAYGGDKPETNFHFMSDNTGQGQGSGIS